MTQKENLSVNPMVQNWTVLAFCLLFLLSCLACLSLFSSKDTAVGRQEGDSALSNMPLIEEPVAQEEDSPLVVEVSFLEEADRGRDAPVDDSHQDSFRISVADAKGRLDAGLALYRSAHTRQLVEWFYINVTESQEVALAILQEADKNEIPLSLAFSLAYTESRYKATAVNRNTNASVDRGIFQLNNRSFPSLTEEEFFDPNVSAKYGMSHLRYCLDTAGNEVSALAMYNAGTYRVRNNGTPQMTLNYISNIFAYRQGLERLFEEEVVRAQVESNEYTLALLMK